MFDNVSEKIKVIAKVIFGFGVVVCLGGIIVALGRAFNWWYDDAITFVGISIAVGGIGISLSSFLVFGFGKLVENSTTIAHSINLSKNEKEEEKTTPTSNVYDTPWICKNCNTSNPASETVCHKCGQSKK